MVYVKLKGTWVGTFSRSVRGPAAPVKPGRQPQPGPILKRLTFNPGEPTEVADEDLAAIAADIGNALIPLDLDRTTGKFTARKLSPRDLEELAALAAGRELPPRPEPDPAGVAGPFPPDPAGDSPGEPEASAPGSASPPPAEAPPEAQPTPPGDAAPGDSAPADPPPAAAKPAHIPDITELLHSTAPPDKPGKKGK